MRTSCPSLPHIMTRENHTELGRATPVPGRANLGPKVRHAPTVQNK